MSHQKPCHTTGPIKPGLLPEEYRVHGHSWYHHLPEIPGQLKNGNIVTSGQKKNQTFMIIRISKHLWKDLNKTAHEECNSNEE